LGGWIRLIDERPGRRVHVTPARRQEYGKHYDKNEYACDDPGRLVSPHERCSFS